MEAVCSSETLVNFYRTTHHITKDSTPRNQRYETLDFHKTGCLMKNGSYEFLVTEFSATSYFPPLFDPSILLHPVLIHPQSMVFS
jgi:hypothetical protein